VSDLAYAAMEHASENMIRAAAMLKTEVANMVFRFRDNMLDFWRLVTFCCEQVLWSSCFSTGLNDDFDLWSHRTKWPIFNLPLNRSSRGPSREDLVDDSLPWLLLCIPVLSLPKTCWPWSRAKARRKILTKFNRLLRNMRQTPWRILSLRLGNFRTWKQCLAIPSDCDFHSIRGVYCTITCIMKRGCRMSDHRSVSTMTWKVYMKIKPILASFIDHCTWDWYTQIYYALNILL